MSKDDNSSNSDEELLEIIDMVDDPTKFPIDNSSKSPDTDSESSDDDSSSDADATITIDKEDKSLKLTLLNIGKSVAEMGDKLATNGSLAYRIAVNLIFKTILWPFGKWAWTHGGKEQAEEKFNRLKSFIIDNLDLLESKSLTKEILERIRKAVGSAELPTKVDDNGVSLLGARNAQQDEANDLASILSEQPQGSQNSDTNVDHNTFNSQNN